MHYNKNLTSQDKMAIVKNNSISVGYGPFQFNLYKRRHIFQSNVLSSKLVESNTVYIWEFFFNLHTKSQPIIYPYLILHLAIIWSSALHVEDQTFFYTGASQLPTSNPFPSGSKKNACLVLPSGWVFSKMSMPFSLRD